MKLANTYQKHPITEEMIPPGWFYEGGEKAEMEEEKTEEEAKADEGKTEIESKEETAKKPPKVNE